MRDFLDPIPALDYTRAMAQRAARVHAQVRAAGRQMGLGDLQIAATAAFSKRVLLTRNTAHFALFVDQDK
ncbi:MAG: type II toxin-antitoxin system VapC family toxin [Pseudopedobacter sp.]|nr:type II toxin-antitoxin system VapC family toxin [Deinococcales bacterium]